MCGYDVASELMGQGREFKASNVRSSTKLASFSPGIQGPCGQYITSLSYNQNAQLSAVNASSGALASYTYDAFGQRVIKTFSGTNGEIYQYGQNGMLLEETNASGIAQADYIYLNGRPIATLDPSTGALYFMNDDLLGTPQLAMDSSQAVAWQATYQPFGTASVSGTITQNLRFPGQYFDIESGWNHNGFRNYIPDVGRYAEPDPLAMEGIARYYDPQIGRLISEDPTGFASVEVNLYVYVADDPINSVDPLGAKSTRYTINHTLPPGSVLYTDSVFRDFYAPSRANWCQVYAAGK